MHKEILEPGQAALLPMVKAFSKNFGLVGGTAIALRIGHRRSLDFDLFASKPFNHNLIRRKISGFARIERVLVDRPDELTVIIGGVKITFFHYPYNIAHKGLIAGIKAPDLLTLAAMKAYALGRRAKWKDYVDLYFIMRDCHGLRQIVTRAKKIFGKEFNEKIFRTQLAYFKDIDYTESVVYMAGREVKDSLIKKELMRFSLTV